MITRNVALLFLILFAAAPASAETMAAGETVDGIGCAIDGDSILVVRSSCECTRLDGVRGPNGRCHAGAERTTEIRLHGIDAPEWRQTCQRPAAPGAAAEEWKCGEEAWAAMARLVDGRAVRCQVLKIDGYGRRVAKCFAQAIPPGEAEGKDVERELVRLGLAVAYRRYSQDYMAVEAEARAAKRGIWAGRFTWPERWRRENR